MIENRVYATLTHIWQRSVDFTFLQVFASLTHVGRIATGLRNIYIHIQRDIYTLTIASISLFLIIIRDTRLQVKFPHLQTSREYITRVDFYISIGLRKINAYMQIYVELILLITFLQAQHQRIYNISRAIMHIGRDEEQHPLNKTKTDYHNEEQT